MIPLPIPCYFDHCQPLADPLAISPGLSLTCEWLIIANIVDHRVHYLWFIKRQISLYWGYARPLVIEKKVWETNGSNDWLPAIPVTAWLLHRWQRLSAKRKNLYDITDSTLLLTEYEIYIYFSLFLYSSDLLLSSADTRESSERRKLIS